MSKVAIKDLKKDDKFILGKDVFTVGVAYCEVSHAYVTTMKEAENIMVMFYSPSELIDSNIVTNEQEVTLVAKDHVTN